ncbi:MAG TPA: helix-turn-helix domain-containing protein [Longimicrobium sp.]|nr:helix-turn-helix domain-containing protein [Longimicrobium sp.]
MLVIDVMVLAGAMPSSVAITTDTIATANRLRAMAGRSPAFALRVSGSGRGIAAHLHAGGDPLPAADPSADAGLVIVPGLGATTEAAVSERFGRKDVLAAMRALERAAGRGGEVAASCSSVFLLAEAGLLDGRRATTTWWLAPLFQRMYPGVRLDPEAMVVADGPVTTAGAAMAQLDLMLALVGRHAGAELAGQCARYLLLDGRRSQARYMAVGYLAAQDADVVRAERWAREHLGTGIDARELADAAGLSPRTFARRVVRATGLSPVRFLQRLRVERAVELLETTTCTVEEIARRVGYAEPTTLRRLLRRNAGARPRELRG